MMKSALAVFGLIAVTGCTSTSPSNDSLANTASFDATAFCMTPEGKQVSEGAVDRGKTCSSSHMLMSGGKKTPLVWQ